MDKPSHQQAGGIHRLSFMDARIDVHVDRLTETTKHEASGEMRITSNAPDAPGHVYQARLNLLSDQTKARLAKTLSEKHPRLSMTEWASILEYVTVMVLEAYRRGEPVYHLADMEASEGLTFRLRPFLQEHQATVLFGEGDTGKSWVALFMAYMVVTGTPKLNMLAEPGHVLYLDYETDKNTVWERLNMLSGGFEEPIPDGFYYRRMHQTIAGDFEVLSREVLDKNIELVVVDSAAPATGEPEAAAATTQYFQALRGLGVTTLTIAHVAKGGRETEPFGSIFWRNLPRSNFRVFSETEPGVPRRVVGLKHTKSNNGILEKERAFELNFDNESRRVVVCTSDASHIPAIEEGRPLSHRIADALSTGARRPSELASELGVDEKQVRNSLAAVANRQRFVSLERGLWGLRYDQ